MNEKEKKKLNTVIKIINKQITIKEAMIYLNQTRRNINRLINKYKKDGEQAFIHKNKGRNSEKKIDRKIINELEELYLSEYYDYNFEAFYEEIEDKYRISYSVMSIEFKKDDIISPMSHKSTVKLYNEKMNNAIKNNNETFSKEKVNLYKTRKAASKTAHIRRSSNLYSFGQEVQMDACEKLWFGDIVSYLHLAVDKATKKVLFGWFEYEEITRGYFVVLYNVIINYGIPSRVKTDNRSSFSIKDNTTVDTTQFGMVCRQLGIDLITTSVATSKANVERENRTFKGRLIAELRHEKITDIDEANKYLNKVFIPKMNKKFSYKINEKTSKMRKNNFTKEELNLIISEKYTRIIDNACSVSYKSKHYVPIDANTGEVVNYSKGTKCTVILDYNGEYWCMIEEKYYMLLEIEKRDKVMEREKDIPKKGERKIYIPPANHPWRKSFKNRF